MDGITNDSIKTAKLMKQLWPQLTDKEAFDEVKGVSFSLIWLGLLCCILALIRKRLNYLKIQKGKRSQTV